LRFYPKKKKTQETAGFRVKYIVFYRILDTTVVERLKKGEESAFRELVETYQHMVFRVCMGVLHNSSDADDVTQEVFIEVFRSVQKFRSHAKISTWLYRIALNKSLNYMRDNRQHKRALQADGAGMEALSLHASERTPLEVLQEKEKKEALEKAVDALPERQKKAFVLSKYEDLSNKEIARVMKLSVSSVESLLFRAKQNLQKSLLA
jgi:RNA polymerase sigma-70 factor (ECF subfamily)